MHHFPNRQNTFFFWANSIFKNTAPFIGELKSDGFHFTGMKTYDGSSLLKLQFGVSSLFELQAERIPRPDQGPWRSAPNIELFGNIIGSTTAEDWFSGDQWSKCWMITRQTIFQRIFAPPGVDNKKILSENTAVQTLIFLEGSNKFQEHRFTGSQPMPPVIINQIFPGISIFAELEVLFLVQLEGGSTFWIDPRSDVIVHTLQWPLEPI
ncbi:hypothetical protein CN282_12375 [Bacillus thuringiensis]|uniref:hypothetical protein n=1 Tax=Bacillus thuringiensis TaxID=1428 RepID=UPI000BF39439|nr:hypothetical protein [Bacillus thuringiensis]PFC51175.1 hypothetical protein CN282_12375 [Bacillus thuringiensis]PGK65772.1 hypothetical protein CN929_21275 [Bacillus thuringiensis]